MLRTSPHRLHRGPHVAIARNQVPACLNKIAGFNLSTQVDRLWISVAAILQRFRPHLVPITFNYGVCAAKFDGFLRVESGVNAAKDHIRAALTSYFANFISAQSIRSVNADTDGVAGLNPLRIHLKQSLVHEYGITENSRCSGSKNVLPSGSDYRRSKRNAAGINQVNVHARCSLHFLKAQPTFAIKRP